jgi:hypothetical protein
VGVPVSHRDRVYAAEQFSHTVSVTDPADNELLGVIRLVDPSPGNFCPLYKEFDHPHLNIFGPETVPQLNEVFTALENDVLAKVVVFEVSIVLIRGRATGVGSELSLALIVRTRNRSRFLKERRTASVYSMCGLSANGRLNSSSTGSLRDR